MGEASLKVFVILMKRYIFRRGRAPARPANGAMVDGTHRGASPTLNNLSFHEYIFASCLFLALLSGYQIRHRLA